MKKVIERILGLNLNVSLDIESNSLLKWINDWIKNEYLYFFLYSVCNYFIFNCKEDYSELLDECLKIINGSINYYWKWNSEIEEELFKELLICTLNLDDSMNLIVANYDINFITI